MSDVEEIKLMRQAVRDKELRKKLISSYQRQRLISGVSITAIPVLIITLRLLDIIQRDNGLYCLFLGTVVALLHIWHLSKQIRYLKKLS